MVTFNDASTAYAIVRKRLRIIVPVVGVEDHDMDLHILPRVREHLGKEFMTAERVNDEYVFVLNDPVWDCINDKMYFAKVENAVWFKLSLSNWITHLTG